MLVPASMYIALRFTWRKAELPGSSPVAPRGARGEMSVACWGEQKRAQERKVSLAQHTSDRCVTALAGTYHMEKTRRFNLFDRQRQVERESSFCCSTLQMPIPGLTTVPNTVV